MIRRPPRSTLDRSSAASDVYKRQYQRRVHGIPLMKISLVIVSLSALFLLVSGEIQWKKEDMEDLVVKDRAPLQRIFGSINELRRIKDKIPPAVYQSQISKQAEVISSFINMTIATETEINEVFEYFIGSGSLFSKATNLRAVFVVATVLTIIALITVVLATGLVVFKHGYSYFEQLENPVKIGLAFFASNALLAYAHFYCPAVLQTYVAILGGIAVSASYVYAIIITDGRYPYPVYLVPALIFWCALAVFFHSKIMGFLSV
eukprot:TRINITY_DN1627_c0_g1_i4.p1 TRINITY_DN1627_c0_g1~~TRINITY_DN1627_c0_g1_i4.p1  ORF type:complete len:262 (+),score=42.64 TRINITY_DN1627_c0_g1_i4:12-797(+)